MCNFLRIFRCSFMCLRCAVGFPTTFFIRDFQLRSVVNVITSYGRLKNYVHAWMFKILILHFWITSGKRKEPEEVYLRFIVHKSKVSYIIKCKQKQKREN